MKIFISMFLSLFVAHLSAFAQNALAQDELKSVDQLSFMEGTWKGEGWILGQDRQINRFSQSEIIQSKVQNSALMVDGLGYALDSTGVTDRVIHVAFGLIAYNPERDRVTMLTFSEMNGRMESNMQLTGDKKLQWSFKEPKSGGTIRFSEDFSEPGKWIEVGEISMNGKDWYQFFAMELFKQ